MKTKIMSRSLDLPETNYEGGTARNRKGEGTKRGRRVKVAGRSTNNFNDEIPDSPR